MNQENTDDFTVFVGNLDLRVTEELLYELFLQSGPLRSVKIPLDSRTKKPMKYGFVTFKHIASVKYAIQLLNGISLFNSPLRLSVKQKKNQSTSEPEPKYNEKLCENNQFQNGNAHQMMPPSHAPIFSNNPYLSREQELYMTPNSPLVMYPPYIPQNTSTPEPMLRSQSFNSSGSFSMQQQHSYRDDHKRNHYNRSRKSSPHYQRPSPSVNKLNRSRSYQPTTDHPSRPCDGRRYKSRDSPNLHHSHDSRRVVSRTRTHNRQSRRSPYNDRSRSHRY